MATQQSNFLLLSIRTTFLLLLLLPPTPTTATTTATPVLDTEGNPLEAGQPYQILLEVTHGGNPGLSLRPRPKGRNCPKYVLQTPIPTEESIPVKFIPSNQTQKHVLVSSNVNGNECTSKPAWKMTSDTNTGRIMVSTDEGTKGNSGVTNEFKIEKDVEGERYKIVYCPSFAPSREIPVCGDLSLFRDDTGVLCPTDGLWWLSLSTDANDSPLWVNFVKA
ncbi:hypothetical protein Cgig2_031278 [Carnegiea gigantea]|uniref:Uncharacterized protein n=1 Tax=Carnegiea gigantea TaxID=171969 RepID=A0A9Q1KM42_9CARY|nr:hypothetical protein Cgig2_031278 [Carnegiea gigantea]